MNHSRKQRQAKFVLLKHPVFNREVVDWFRRHSSAHQRKRHKEKEYIQPSTDADAVVESYTTAEELVEHYWIQHSA